MKTFERIFLYSVLVVLVFYVFLVDGTVESKTVIQEEIRARSISIVNDAGQVVVNLYADEDGGVISISNKDSARVALMGALKDGDGGIGIYNKAGNAVAGIVVSDDSGFIGVHNKYGISVATMGVAEDGGRMSIYNKAGTYVVGIESCVSGGIIGVRNKAGTPIAGIAAYENDGMIAVYNRQGDLIGSLP